MIIEISNPKNILFYPAILAQFVMLEAEPQAPPISLLNQIVMISAFPCDLFFPFPQTKQCL